MEKIAAIVIFTDELSESNRAMARFIYGCIDESCLVLVDSHSEMVKKLREYKEIGQLVFLLHGVLGSIGIKNEFRDIEYVANLLKGTKTTIKTEIIFEGCSVAEAPERMVPLVTVLHAPRASGFSVFHFWGEATKPITVKKGDNAEMLDATLKKYEKYLLPNQQNAAAMVKRPGQKKLFAEWFTRNIGASKFPQTVEQRREVFSRNELVNKTYTAKEAETAFAELTEQGGPMYLVTVLAPPLTEKESKRPTR